MQRHEGQPLQACSLLRHDDDICKEVAPVNLMCKASFLGVCTDENDGDHEEMQSLR